MLDTRPAPVASAAGTLVCGVDDSPHSRRAARLAAETARKLGLRLVLVYVVEAPGGDPAPAHAAAAARRTLDLAVAELPSGAAAETRVVFGEPADMLARVAADEAADLVVIGARPAGLGGRQLRYALARELEAATSAPLLLAPGAAA